MIVKITKKVLSISPNYTYFTIESQNGNEF